MFDSVKYNSIRMLSIHTIQTQVPKNTHKRGAIIILIWLTPLDEPDNNTSTNTISMSLSKTEVVWTGCPD